MDTSVLALPRADEKNDEKKSNGRANEATRNGARPWLGQKTSSYSNPETRKRVTGSDIDTGWRLKIQRATAMPTAA